MLKNVVHTQKMVPRFQTANEFYNTLQCFECLEVWQCCMWLITLQLSSPDSITTASSLRFARRRKLEFSSLHCNSSQHWGEKKWSDERCCCLIKRIWFARCDIPSITKWTCGEITIEGYKYCSRVTPALPTMKCMLLNYQRCLQINVLYRENFGAAKHLE